MRVGLIAVATVIGAPAFVSADAIAPDHAACAEQDEGDDCSFGEGDGTCVPGTCYRNDYSNGPPPRSVPYPCLVCEPGEGFSGGQGGSSGCSVNAPARGSAGAWLPLALGLGWIVRRRRG